MGKRGGQAVCADAAIQACLTIKVLFDLPLRQTTGFVASLLKWLTSTGRAGFLDALPTPEGAGRALRVTDSTGIKIRGEGERPARKHGGARRPVWRKVPLAVDEATLEVRAMGGSRAGDAPVLPDLLGQIPEGEEIASVSALSADCFAVACRATDGACDTRGCRDAIADRAQTRSSRPGAPQAMEEGQPLGGSPERGATYH